MINLKDYTLHVRNFIKPLLYLAKTKILMPFKKGCLLINRTNMPTHLSSFKWFKKSNMTDCYKQNILLRKICV